MAFIYDLTDTWNAGGTTFNAIKMNVTDTASAAASKLITVQVSGTEKFSVKKDGVGYFAGNVGIGTSSPSDKLNISSSSNQIGLDTGDQATYGTLDLGHFTNGAFIGTQAGSNSGSNLLRFGTSGTERMRITSSGNTVIADGKFLSWGNEGQGLLGENATSALRLYTAYNERLRITSAGDVGIGTSSPGAKLALSTSTNNGILIDTPMSAAAYAEVRARYTGVDNCQSAIRFYNPNNAYGGAFTVWTQPESNGAAMVERMRISSGGDVSVGTTADSSSYGNTSSFIVQTASSTDGIVATLANSGSTGAALQFFQNGVDTATIGMPAGTGGITFKPSGTTERMRIDSSGNVLINRSSASGLGKLNVDGGADFTNGNVLMCRDTGNVGIGTSSPAVKLEAAGTTRITNATVANSAIFQVTADATGSNGVNLESTYYGAGGFGPLKFTTSNTERARIDSSGNLLVGTTAASGGKFIVKEGATNFEVNTSGTDVALLSYDRGASAYKQLNLRGSEFLFKINDVEKARIDTSGNLLVGTTSSSVYNSTNSGHVIEANGTVQHSRSGFAAMLLNRIASDGSIVEFFRQGSGVGSISVTTSATAYNTSSDYRLKDIDGPVANSGAYIDALKPVQGSWKADGSRFIGLLAHEVQEVSETQIATGEKDGEEMQAMDYSSPELIANLIAEIQSLRARVAQLEG